EESQAPVVDASAPRVSAAAGSGDAAPLGDALARAAPVTARRAGRGSARRAGDARTPDGDPHRSDRDSGGPSARGTPSYRDVDRSRAALERACSWHRARDDGTHEAPEHRGGAADRTTRGRGSKARARTSKGDPARRARAAARAERARAGAPA